jgi:hypothetical protein
MATFALGSLLLTILFTRWGMDEVWIDGLMDGWMEGRLGKGMACFLFDTFGAEIRP